ncbi:hypothetical protein [Halalkalicoccus salilacus]|uniref:hypothetical protein n=1 Tax=Halalkalicoccus salilacus TaxID=3117459 RepID=UPI00300EC0CA
MTERDADTDDIENSTTTDTSRREESREEVDTGHTTDSFMPILARATVLSGKVLWISGRAILLGILVVATVIADERRRDRFRRWIFLEGDRWLIIGGMVGSVFLVSLVLTATNVIGVRESRFVTTMFSTIIAGLFSFVPIVIAVNQLTVSQLFETPAGLRERIDSVHEFRVDLEKMVSDELVAPTEPARFLAQIVEVVSERMVALQQAVSETAVPGSPLVDDVDQYVQTTRLHVEEIDDQLRGTNLPLIEVLLPMIGDDYSERANIARRIQETHGDALSESATELLDDLRELAISLDVLRQYFKALYIQQELSNLSRLIAASGTVAFLVSMFLVMLFATGDPSPHHPLILQVLVSLGLATAFAPLAILLSFMLRVATIAKQTAAPGAFTPKRETPDYVQ